MTPPIAPEAPKPDAARPFKRGPVPLLRLSEIRRLNGDWCTTREIVEIFREAQRVAR